MISRPGSFVRDARRKAGLTQRALSKESGVPQPTIAAIEQGERDARYMTLERLLRACGFDLDIVRRPDVPIDRGAIRRHLRLSRAERWKVLQEGQQTLTPFPVKDHEIDLAVLVALRDELEARERARRARRRGSRSERAAKRERG